MGAPKTESSVDSRPPTRVSTHVQKHVQKTVPQGPGCLDTCARDRRHGSRTSHCARPGSSGRCCEPIFLSDVQSQCRRKLRANSCIASETVNGIFQSFVCCLEKLFPSREPWKTTKSSMNSRA